MLPHTLILTRTQRKKAKLQNNYLYRNTSKGILMKLRKMDYNVSFWQPCYYHAPPCIRCRDWVSVPTDRNNSALVCDFCCQNSTFLTSSWHETISLWCLTAGESSQGGCKAANLHLLEFTNFHSDLPGSGMLDAALHEKGAVWYVLYIWAPAGNAYICPSYQSRIFIHYQHTSRSLCKFLQDTRLYASGSVRENMRSNL